MRYLFFTLLLLPLLGPCQTDAIPAGGQPIRIIPQPRVVEPKEGQFTLNAQTRLYFPDGQPDWEMAVQYFMALVQAPTGFQLMAQPMQRTVFKPRSNAIYFVKNEEITAAEGYRMEVRNTYIMVQARTAAGAFYAVQTLRQLFPPELNGSAKAPAVHWSAPACIIDDAPRFGYRGLHLDVGRHFFPVAFIKRYIDLLALHKLNRFHWHLTEDQGWRIEIKRYPALQTVAAFRKETMVGHYTDLPRRFDGQRYGGYYTQEEVREVVEYARRRFVTVVPEIELPGHAKAALAAYPELGCTGGPYETHTEWGVVEDVFCAGNDQTFTFLDNVLEEVCALFPGQYVHIGGDECPKTRWEACPKCQQRKKTEGLKDEHELQSYVIRQAEKILAKRGKKLIGWDEILEGGLAPSATVMSWRGVQGGIDAAKAGHDVIMTPGTHCYFDHYQSDPTTEPVAIGGFLTLEKVYSYEPVPAELTAEQGKYILGAQANLWTEYIRTTDYAEYMAYPRACALAEVVWSDPARKNWPDFAARLKTHFARLEALKVNYAKSYFDLKADFTGGKVTLSGNDPAAAIHYTLDGSEPTAASARFEGPLGLAKTTTVKAAAFQQNAKVGKTMRVHYAIHKASGKPYTLSKKPEQYAGGETYALTNGVSGALKTWNNWVGLVNHDIDPLIDFGAATTFDSIGIGFLCARWSYIYPPVSAEAFVSDDGKTFRSIGKVALDGEKDVTSGTTGRLRVATPGASGRFLKVVIQGTGVVPVGRKGAGEGAWLFVDEIAVH
jgi:hexosaminidase